MTITASRITRLRTTTRRTLIAATALAATASLAASTAAQAAGPRPNFQLPVSCGQVWEASTYWTNPGEEDEKKHWPNLNSVDLAQRDGEGDNLSEGEPALASADGTVTRVKKADNGEVQVFLDHGNGWETYYIHLVDVPPLTIGQAVAQGEQIGTVGKSGADSPHLHYTQLADGVAVRVVVNGLGDRHVGGRRVVLGPLRRRREAHEQQLPGARVPAVRRGRQAPPVRLHAGHRRDGHREHQRRRQRHRQPVGHDVEPALDALHAVHVQRRAALHRLQGLLG